MELSIQSLRVDNQYLRSELGYEANQENQKKDEVEKDSMIQQLRTDVEQHKKSEVELEQLRKPMPSQLESTRHLFPTLFINPLALPAMQKIWEGGWTINLRRFNGSVDFNRSWTEYKNEFGELDGEFFLRLDKIHALAADGRQELLVVLESSEGEEGF